MFDPRSGPARPTHAVAPRGPDARPRRRHVTLADKYRLEQGTIVLGGVQALVRGAVDVLRADHRAGRATAGFVSGYQGSPLGGLDKELERERDLLAEVGLVHRPGLNEELAATSVMGSQLVGTLPGALHEGVVGTWYGKAPGLDRAADAIRHANLAGTSPTGGVLALVGDDPAAKSSTLPSASEPLLAALHVPVLAPGDVQQALDLALHGYALSRAAGVWAALKVVTDVADAAATAEVHPDRVRPVLPILAPDGTPYVHRPTAHFLNPTSSMLEASLHGIRLPLVREYARCNGLDVVTHRGPSDRVGIVAAGTAARAVARALAELGLDDHDLRRQGVRLLRVGMVWPLEPTGVRAFARGLDAVLVVEEKLPFLETAVRDVLYGTADAPAVRGAASGADRPLWPTTGALDADDLALGLARWLDEVGVAAPAAPARIAAIHRARDRAAAGRGALPARTPFFCSGCPHNSSTDTPDGTVVGAGIGCHTMVLLNPAGKGELAGVTQMGGEGAQFIGMAPFTSTGHVVQNLGDGTFHHSGSLAIRAAVAAGLDITYKILANGTVAMTGAQDIEGHLDVPALTRWLEIEGVRRIVVTSDDPARLRDADLSAIATVRPREDLVAVQEELAREPGVTVLVHDQGCAAEKRRDIRRGRRAAPTHRVVINERVCEGCGDCGAKSSCLSVLPVETGYGRKTRIHQASCNTDLSCLEGDCPSFVRVRVDPDATPPRRAAVPVPPEVPDPPRRVHGARTRVRLVGVGGTGVVTIAQVLGMAAVLDGLHLAALDQTGLAQKGGPVVSDLVLGHGPVHGGGRIGAGTADVLLGLDALGTADPRMLAVADPGRTVAVVSTTATPTGRMVVDPDERFPATDRLLDAIGRACAPGLVHLDAQALAQRLFGDHMPANAIVLGAAHQSGLLPVSAAAVEEAFRMNGAGAGANLLAFAWGRAVVAAPEAVAALEVPHPEPAPADLDALVAARAGELARHSTRRVAARYRTAVAHVAAAERRATPGRDEIARAYADGLFKLMAYKDEYEVARLHLLPEERARVAAEFGTGARTALMLHPPLLRALGVRRKIAVGRWGTPLLRALVAMRRLRGTWADPFGHAHVRRVERELVDEYRTLVEAAVADLRPEDAVTALEIARLPELVRGYESVKLAGVARFRARAAELTGGAAHELVEVRTYV